MVKVLVLSYLDREVPSHSKTLRLIRKRLSMSKSISIINLSRLQSGTTTAITFSNFMTSKDTNESQRRIPSALLEVVQQRVQSGNPNISHKQTLKRIQSAVMFNNRPSSYLSSPPPPQELTKLHLRDEEEADVPIVEIQRSNKITSMFNSTVSSQQSQYRMIVTEANLESPEILKRMKFDPDVRSQVLRLKTSKITDRNLKNILTHITVKQKGLIEAVKS